LGSPQSPHPSAYAANHRRLTQTFEKCLGQTGISVPFFWLNMTAVMCTT
jgi:hypothetical protein